MPESLSNGIYEEINFKMVFLVKDSNIYRLLWNHVKEKGIISKRIDNTSDYTVENTGLGDHFSLKNGFLFEKIEERMETVNDTVKNLYHANMKYLNRKFFKRSSSGETNLSGKTNPSDEPPDLSSVVSLSRDLNLDINQHSKDYQDLIAKLSEQQGLIYKLQQQSDNYLYAGLEILEKFRNAQNSSEEDKKNRNSIIEQYQEYIRSKETGINANEKRLREELKLYDQRLQEANNTNNELNDLISIDGKFNRLLNDEAFTKGQAQGQARGQVEGNEQAQAQARTRARAQARELENKNKELERRRKQALSLGQRNKSLEDERQVLLQRLNEADDLLQQEAKAGNDIPALSSIIEGLRMEKDASEQRRIIEIERIQEQKRLQEEQIQSLREELNDKSSMLQLKEEELKEQELQREKERAGLRVSPGGSTAAVGAGGIADCGELQNEHDRRIEELQFFYHQAIEKNMRERDLSCRQQMNNMVEPYHRDIQGLQGEYDRIQGEYDRIQGDYNRIQGEYDTLYQECEQLQEQQGQQDNPVVGSAASAVVRPRPGLSDPSGPSGQSGKSGQSGAVNPPAVSDAHQVSPGLVSQVPQGVVSQVSPGVSQVPQGVVSQVSPGESGLDKAVIDSCQ